MPIAGVGQGREPGALIQVSLWKAVVQLCQHLHLQEAAKNQMQALLQQNACLPLMCLLRLLLVGFAIWVFLGSLISKST